MGLERKIDFVQIGDSEEARELASAFAKRGKSVAVLGFSEGIGQYAIHKMPGLNYCCFGNINLRALPHTAQMLDIRDYSDPVEWEKMLDSVTANKSVDGLFKKVSKCSGDLAKKLLREHGKEYPGFKEILNKSISPRYLFLSQDCQVYCSEQLLDKLDTGTFGNIASLFYHLVAIEVIENTRDRLENNRLSEAETLNDKADELNEKGRYKEALPYSDKALGLSPRFSLAWINKGIALKNLGRFDEAMDCYDHVIANINHEYKKAWYNKANALIIKGEIEEAERCVDKALEIDLAYPHALTLKMMLTI